MSRRRGRHYLKRPAQRDGWLTDELRETVELAADVAFDTGSPVLVAEFVVVPDVFVEAYDEFPKQHSFRIVRDDGRWVDLYRAPRGWAA